MAHLAPIEMSCKYCGLGIRRDGTKAVALVQDCPDHDFNVHHQDIATSMTDLAPIEQSCKHCGLGIRRDGTKAEALARDCPGHEFHVHPQVLTSPVRAPSGFTGLHPQVRPPPFQERRNVSDRVFGLVACIDGAYTPIGTSFIIRSQPGTLLLTAHHCLTPGADHYALVKTIVRNKDGTCFAEPKVPIKVQVVAGDPVSDVAILKAEHVLGAAIPICPADQYPDHFNEDVVKCCHCPCQLFNDEQIDIFGVLVIEFVKVDFVSQHHIYVPAEPMRGSSGGIVTDEQCRGVGLICSGAVADAPLLNVASSLGTVWENMTAESSGGGVLIRATRLSAVNRLEEVLEEFLRAH